MMLLVWMWRMGLTGMRVRDLGGRGDPVECGERFLRGTWRRCIALQPIALRSGMLRESASHLDRLLHFSGTINIRGHSYLLREKRRAGVLTELTEIQREG